MTEEESVGLLGKDEAIKGSCSSCQRCQTNRLSRFLISFLLHSLLATCLVVFLWLFGLGQNDPSIQLYSPAKDHVEYETKRFYRSRGDDKSPYQGWPNDERDKLWQDTYYAGLLSHIDGATAAKLSNQTSRVAIPGLEQDYMVVLDVFHQLHCLDQLRMSLYPERYGRSMYYPNGTLNYCVWLHLDHCIDQVRQSLMCHSDISVIPFQWNDATKGMRPRVDTLHTCRNYEKLKAWAFPKNVSVFHGASRVVEQDGRFVIEDYLEAKWKGLIKVEDSECHAI